MVKIKVWISILKVRNLLQMIGKYQIVQSLEIGAGFQTTLRDQF